MENITEILASLGIEIPEDKKQDLATRVAANYKTVAEFDKKINKATEDAENLSKQLDTAQKTIDAFNGADVEGMKAKLTEYQQQIETMKNDQAQKAAEREFEEALKASLDGVKFSSNAAREAVTAKIKGAGLKLVDGKILGLNDMLEGIKKADATAFEEDAGGDSAKFTRKTGNGGGKKYSTKEEIYAIKDAAERQKAIADNIRLFK